MNWRMKKTNSAHILPCKNVFQNLFILNNGSAFLFEIMALQYVMLLLMASKLPCSPTKLEILNFRVKPHHQFLLVI